MNKGRAADRIRRFDHPWPFLYKDGRGEVTIGLGHAVNSTAAALSVPWAGSPNNSQIIRDWVQVSRSEAGHPPLYYAGLSRVRIEGPAIDWVLDTDIGVLLSNLAVLISDFATMPEAAQEALFDLAFTMEGAGLGLLRMSRFMAACALKDWQTAALESRREFVTEARNAEVAGLLIGIYDAAKATTRGENLV